MLTPWMFLFIKKIKAIKLNLTNRKKATYRNSNNNNNNKDKDKIKDHI